MFAPIEWELTSNMSVEMNYPALRPTLCSGYCFHLTEEAEAQRGKGAWPESLSGKGAHSLRAASQFGWLADGGHLINGNLINLMAAVIRAQRLK